MTPESTEPTLVADDPSGVDGGDNDTIWGEGASGPTPPERRVHWLREAVIVVLVALVVALLLRAFVVQTFFIPSGSMEPTLQIGDRILVNKLSYHLHGVDRGDIVVFSRPPTENCGGPTVNDLVKRVIGLPGDTVSLNSGYVYIDGKKLDESWLPSSEQGVTTQGPAGNTSNLAQPFKVPANDYFVMGDNREDSCDSRYWGPIAKSLIVGKVELRVWPLTAIHLF